jgi:hypothetical protein
MTVVLDGEGLTSAARQLSASTAEHTAAVAQPPGTDVTSVSAVGGRPNQRRVRGAGSAPQPRFGSAQGRRDGGSEHCHRAQRPR